jgi:Heterokaryon incompatibility protein (HET)
MRFLDTHAGTLCFQEVADSELHLDENKYAIPSHRWGADNEEVSYDDIQHFMDISHKKGFAKLKGFCRLASAAGCRYAWIDTCCVNKVNSTELREAVNSMCRWYQESKICIVYLEDVPTKQIMESEWFERGWTLQELIITILLRL